VLLDDEVLSSLKDEELLKLVVELVEVASLETPTEEKEVLGPTSPQAAKTSRKVTKNVLLIDF
jgi:hypothetical protein